MFVSQATQVLLVSLMIGVFLTVFGVLAVDDEIRIRWLGKPRQRAARLRAFRRAPGADQPSCSGSPPASPPSPASTSRSRCFTDSTYRQEFLEELTSEMRESFSERAEYLRLRERLGAGAGSESATIGG